MNCKLQQAIPANASFELAELNENQEKEDTEKPTAAAQDPEMPSEGGKTSDSKDAGGPVEKGERCLRFREYLFTLTNLLTKGKGAQ